MQKTISQSQNERRPDKITDKNQRKISAQQSLSIHFAEATSIAKTAFSDLSNNLSNRIRVSKKYISMKEIVFQISQFFENVELNSRAEKNLVAAFAPVHSYFMSLIFKHYPSKPNPFLISWNVFSQSFKIFAEPPKYSFNNEIGKLKELLDDVYNESIEAFEETLLSFDSSKLQIKAIDNFSPIIENNHQAQEVFEKIKEKIKKYEFFEKTKDLILNIDKTLETSAVYFKDKFTNDDMIFFMQSSLKYALLCVQNNERISFDNSMKLMKCARTLLHLSEFVEPIDLKETYDNFVSLIKSSINQKNVNDEEDIKILQSWLFSDSFSSTKESGEFTKFCQLHKELNKSPTANITTAANTYSSFLNFITNIDIFGKKEAMKSIDSAIERILVNCSLKILDYKISEDAASVKDFVSNSKNSNDDVRVAIASLVKVIDEAYESKALNPKYKDLMKRFGLIAKTSCELLNIVSTSLVERTTIDFCKYFPNITKFDDLFIIPELEDEENCLVNNAIVSEDAESVSNALEELLDLIEQKRNHKVSDEFNENVRMMSKFLYKTVKFFRKFVVKSEISKYQVIVEPTETTKLFADLIDALSPVAVNSVTLTEHTYGLALVALYKEFSAESTAIRPFQNISAQLTLPSSMGSGKFIPCIISAFVALSSKGEVDLPKEDMLEIEHQIKGVFELNSDVTFADFQKGIEKIEKFLPKSTIVSSIKDFSSTIRNYSNISDAMRSIAKHLSINDKISSSLMENLIIAQDIQIIFNFAKQLGFKVNYETIGGIWPMSSKLFADASNKETMQKLIDFVISISRAPMTLPSTLYCETAQRAGSTLSCHLSMLKDEAEITKLIKKFILVTQTSSCSKKMPNNKSAYSKTQKFAQKLLIIMFKLLICLEKKPKTYVISALISDVTYFQALTFEFLSFCELNEICRTTFKAISRLPKEIRPEIPDEDKIFNKTETVELESKKKSHSFDEKLSKLRETLKKKGNSKAMDVFEQISPLLDNPCTSVDSELVDLSIRQFINNEQILNAKLIIKRKEIYEEIAALNSRMSLQSQTSRETSEIKKKIHDTNLMIQHYETRLQDYSQSIELVDGDIEETKSQLDLIKKEITPGDLLLIESNKDDTPLDPILSDHTQPDEKANNLEEFIETVKKQNIKLKTAIKRAKIAKEVPCLAGEKKVRSTIMKKFNDLTADIEEKEKKLYSFNRSELTEVSKIKPIEINDSVLTFIRMASKIRCNKYLGISVDSFLSALDSAEKYAYDISQNRREFAKYLDL